MDALVLQCCALGAGGSVDASGLPGASPSELLPTNIIGCVNLLLMQLLQQTRAAAGHAAELQASQASGIPVDLQVRCTTALPAQMPRLQLPSLLPC